MPIIGSEMLEQRRGSGSHYGYSATRLADIEAAGASEYTLVVIVNDVSISVGDFKPEMEKCLAEIVKACQRSPRADNLMVRLVQFGSNVEETHGFKLLTDCNLADYDNCLNIHGMTALCDGIGNAIESLGDWAKQLTDQDYTVNAILVGMTDGCENDSNRYTPETLRDKFKSVLREEHLESLVSILVGVNVDEPQVSATLSDFRREVGFTQYEEVANADAKTLARLAAFVSQSVSSQSSALGTGSASVPLHI